MATCVETSGVDLRTRTRQREGEKAEGKVRCKVFAHREESGLPEQLHEDWNEEVVEDGFAH